MSLISKTAQYALRTMSLLAAHEDRLTVRELAQSVGAPQPYLARIVMSLVNLGLVDARRGPGGGLKLGREAKRIRLMEIISCFDGDALFEDCCLGLPGCGERHAKCPLHDDWRPIRKKIRLWWEKTTLDKLEPGNTIRCLRERVQDFPDMAAKS